MTPTDNEHSPGDQNRGISGSHRKRRRRHKKRNKTLAERFTKTFKTNPLKILAPFFLGSLIFLTILFFLYDDGDKVLVEDEKFLKKNNFINGILLTTQISNGEQAILIDLGYRGNNISGDSLGLLVSLKNLQQGYTVSPMNFINCGNQGIIEDSLKFVLSTEGNRLYVNGDFKNIFTNEVAGTVDKKRWTLLSKDIFQFYSDDNLFEVLD